MSLKNKNNPIEQAEALAPHVGTEIPAEQLFRGTDMVVIMHNGDRYQLRITRNKKLILTK